MKKFTSLCVLLLSTVCLFAATYRTYIGHYIETGTNTYAILVDSDTAFGETAIGQICYTPPGGGATAFTGFVSGIFDATDIYPGANWLITITVPAGATNIKLELATLNQSNSPYGYTGCNIVMSNVLAVELQDFNANVKSKTVQLDWTTATERDHSHFVVERSTNSVNFKPLATVDAEGGNVIGGEYTFTDEAPATGVNYYRLQFVERTGNMEYGPIKTVVVGKGTREIFAYPNPATSELNIQVELEGEEDLNIQVLDMLGRVQFVQTQSGVKGNNTLRIDTQNLPVGQYALQVNGAVTRFERR